MTNQYLTFASCVQALRRRVEAATYGRGGALGVAADPYPHQLATVERILTDIRIRHLISDEVGLGKTVQALMIVNALRWQNTKHRTVIVAPERLTKQWQDEIWTRAHLKAAVPGADLEERDEDPAIWIVRPQSLQDHSFELSWREHDLLIVDEPQIMPVDVIDDIVRKSYRFRQMLVLSATPRLGDPRWWTRIMTILEPERAEIASRKDMLLDEYLEVIESDALDRLDDNRNGGPALWPETVFATSSIQRRIIRQTRQDWGHYLPGRKAINVVIDPVTNERQRNRIAQEAMKKYGDQGDLKAFPWNEIKALPRSRGAAMEALRLLAGESDLTDVALETRKLVLEDPGDTRLEALLDILSRDWSRNADERFVIVAGDTGTIDMLSGALSRYFPELASNTGIAELRRPAAAAVDAFGSIVAMSESLEAFVRGEARVLLTGDWVQAGLNLHHVARNIIFYNLPWEPDAVDQLIGRIDRLRRNGLWKGDKGRHFGSVRIWRLVMSGMPEERVADGLDAVRVFDRPLPPLSREDHVQINEKIEALARGAKDSAILDSMSGLARSWQDEENYSDLEPFCPYQPDMAARKYEAWNQGALVEPVLSSPKPDLPFMGKCEKALGGWLNLIEKSEGFNVGWRQDRKDETAWFRTFWYQGEQPGQPFYLSCLGEDRWSADHVPFIYRRQDLQAPPQRTVYTREEEAGGRLLRFLDHGDDLHEGLVEGYRGLGEKLFRTDRQNSGYIVRVDKAHPALVFEGETILLTAAYSDPSNAFSTPVELRKILDLIKSAPTKNQKTILEQDKKLLREMLRADQRWLRSKIAARLDLRAAKLAGNSWQDIRASEVSGLFRPLMTEDKGEPVPRCMNTRFPVGRKVLTDGQAHHHKSVLWDLKNGWGKKATDLEGEMLARLVCIRAEGEDLIRIKSILLDQRAAETPSEKQKNMWRGQVEAAERQVKMVEFILEARCNALEAARKKLGAFRPGHVWHLLLRFIPFDD